MSLLKQSETTNESTMRRNRGAESMKRAARAPKAAVAQISPNPVLANCQSFAEDFLLEHSASGLHFIKFEVPGTSARTTQESSELSQLFGFPS